MNLDNATDQLVLLKLLGNDHYGLHFDYSNADISEELQEIFWIIFWIFIKHTPSVFIQSACKELKFTRQIDY